MVQGHFMDSALILVGFDHFNDMIIASETYYTSFLVNCVCKSKGPCFGGRRFGFRHGMGCHYSGNSSELETTLTGRESDNGE